jgi:hypothetical protein
VYRGSGCLHPRVSRAANGRQLNDGDLALSVQRSDQLLVLLAHARLRQLLDERPALGQPPLRHLVAEVGAQVVGIG